MRVAIKFRTPAGWLDGSSWVFVLLALLTLVPAACVLWFMNEALTRESDTSRQRVLEAYRGQLRLVRARLDPLWRAHAASLEATGDPEQQFQRLMVTQMADGAVLLDRDGLATFPNRDAAHSRQGSEIEQRLNALVSFNSKPGAADLDAVAARLNDYTTHLPAPERLRLMDRLRVLGPNVSMPTQAALQLSLEMPTRSARAGRRSFVRRPSRHLGADSGGQPCHRALPHRTSRRDDARLPAPDRVDRILFVAIPPDEPADAEAIAAGPWLPGWQVSFVVLTRPMPHRPIAGHHVPLGWRRGAGRRDAHRRRGGPDLRRHLRVARLKTDLVAAASHELRTPLASMRVLVDGLLADTEFDASRTREYLEMMSVENARLSRLIENFLTFSRLDRGRYRFAFAPADPSEIVTSAVEAVRDRLPTTSTLDVDVEPVLPQVMVDAEAVSTALVNLLDNALKYTPDEKRITVRACHDGDGFVQFVVSDNGIGIPVREQRRIFRRFYRVDRRLARETGGVGLGLSIVELIARGHGGTVTVRSEPGEGSTFTMRVPRAAEDATA